MSNSVSDGGAAGPYLDNIEIREGDEEQLLDIVSLGEKVFMSSWNEQMVATSMYGTYRKCGMGHRLMKEMIRMCVEDNVEKIFLEVRESNDTAISMYESLGFDEISRRKDYYKKPTEDAVIMELKCSHS